MISDFQWNWIEQSFSQLPTVLQMVFSLFVGAVMGSFLSVVCYRWPRGMSVVSPGSRSTDFKSPIPWFRNIPLFSYVWFWGRAQHTGRKYSSRYFFLELVTACLFVMIYGVHGWQIDLIFYWLVASVLIAASFIDLELRQIPDALTWGAWGAVLFLALLQSQAVPLTFTESFIGGLLGFGLFFIVMQGYYWVTGEDGMGFGDVKFMGFIGAALGAKAVVEVTLAASLLGLLVGLIFILLLKKGRRFPIPFGPFLAAGGFLVIFDISLLELLQSLLEFD